MTFLLVLYIIDSTKYIPKEDPEMSIVRYTNKKTGVVTLYESTSHYDPETKQSRPIRKYLGVEDPETGKLIPSSGLRGRKKADGQIGKILRSCQQLPKHRHGFRQFVVQLSISEICLTNPSYLGVDFHLCRADLNEHGSEY